MSNKSVERTIFTSFAQRYTNIPLLPVIIVALIGGSVTLGLIYLLKGMLPALFALIHQRGSVQYITMYSFWLALGMVAFKWQMVAKERKAFSLPYVQQFTASKETVGKVTMLEQYSEIDENLDAQQKKLLLINRINKAVKQLRISNSPSDVTTVLSTVSSTDSAVIDSSYIPLKFMIWIIPIWGFIGTVIGMSAAIGSFDFLFQQIKNIGFQGVQSSLGKVTSGLGVAFDTTFLALVLCAFINFLTNIIQKREEDLLSDIEEFTTDNIINKLSTLNIKSRIEQIISPTAPGDKLGSALESLSRDLKNLSGQNQVNADAIQSQVGRAIESIQTLANQQAQGMTPEIGTEFPAALREFSLALKDSSQSFQAIGELSQLVKNNLAMLEILKGSVEESMQINKKLGELYGKIYKTSF
jgi:biopolymer transport protein ExbB/TolQ